MRPPRHVPRRKAPPGNEQWVVGVFFAMAVSAFICLKMLATRNQPHSPVPEPPRGPVGVYAGGEDPRMDQAIQEARRRWPEFAAAFQERQGEGQLFNVHALLSEGGQQQLRWIAVTHIEGDTIQGTLEQGSGNSSSAPGGQTTTIVASAVTDWMFAKDGEIVGGFTMKAIQAIQGL